MRTRAALRGVGLLTLEVAAVAILHRADLPSVEWSHVSDWLDATAPEDAIIASVRALALAGTYYLIVTTFLLVLAAVVRVPSLLRGVELISLPGLRRAIEGMAAVSIAATPLPLASPAFAHDYRPAVDATEVPSYSPVAAGDTDSYEPTPAGDDDAGAQGATHVVVAGESLWMIAEAVVPQVTQHRRGVVERYWLTLVDVNASKLRSGDANLIFPGEAISLPPLEDGRA